MESNVRWAIVRRHANKVEAIVRYMPSNYTVRVQGDDVLISGIDNAGWTLDGYVIPRLASGLYFAEEITGTAEVPGATAHRVTVDDIVAYENGDLSALATLELFGALIASGQAWTLQGSYGRAANAFLEEGLIDPDGTITDLAHDRLADIPESDDGGIEAL
jgi:hypothetical protein